MFNIGFFEILVIIAVFILLNKPKDMPKIIKKIKKYSNKIKKTKKKIEKLLL